MSVCTWLADTVKKHRHNVSAGELVRESIQQKKFDPERDFNVKELAIACCGESFATPLLAYGAAARSGRGFLTTDVKESADALDASTFGAVFGSVMVEIGMKAYETATSVVEGMFDTYPTPDQLDEITEWKQAEATSAPATVAPGMPYPRSGAASWFTKIPKPEKVGFITEFTLEMVVMNRSKPILDLVRANSLRASIEMVERMLRVVLGITNNYNQNGTTYNTYLNSGVWINSLDDFDLSRGPDEVDRLEQQFANMVDPVTGKNIVLGGTDIFVPYSNLRRTQKVVNTTEIRETASGREVVYAEPGTLKAPKADRHARRLLVESGVTTAIADTYFHYGDFPGAFGWREVRPFEVLQRSAELASDINWNQDIIYGVKPRFWGCPFVKDPRKVTRGRKTA
jgi:hypothetical protein